MKHTCKMILTENLCWHTNNGIQKEILRRLFWPIYCTWNILWTHVAATYHAQLICLRQSESTLSKPNATQNKMSNINTDESHLKWECDDMFLNIQTYFWRISKCSSSDQVMNLTVAHFCKQRWKWDTLNLKTTIVFLCVTSEYLTYDLEDAVKMHRT